MPPLTTENRHWCEFWIRLKPLNQLVYMGNRFIPTYSDEWVLTTRRGQSMTFRRARFEVDLTNLPAFIAEVQVIAL